MKFCTLASGSDGNSSVLSSENSHILIDIGISNRAICCGLQSIGISHDEIRAVFITHEHGDHVRGLEVWAKNHNNCVYFAAPQTAKSLRQYHPQIEIIAIDEKTQFENFEVTTIFTSHDTPDSVAYLFEFDGYRVMTVTDSGCLSDKLLQNMCGLDLLLIETNYDKNMLKYGKYPQMLKDRISGDLGHLSNDDGAEAAVYAARHGCKCILLGHLSADNNSPKCAYETVHRYLLNAGIIPGVDVNLSVAPRGKVGTPIEIVKEKL